MHVFRALITGGELTDLEKALGEGLGVFRRHALADVTSARNRSILVLLALNEHPLDQIQVGCYRYGQSLERYRYIHCNNIRIYMNVSWRRPGSALE